MNDALKTYPRIVTSHVRPPVPTRKWDWTAHRDDYEPGQPIGEGATEQAAIADLCEQLDICPPDCWCCRQEANAK